MPANAPGREPSSRMEHAVLVGCLIVLLALRWHPIWPIGFYQDDALTSDWIAEATATDRSVLAVCLDVFLSAAKFQGRIAPIYAFAILPLIIVIAERLWLYRILQAASHVGALVAFSAWLRRAGAGAPYVYLSLATLASIYEIRDYHDPAFSQAMTLSATALLGFLALERAEAVRSGADGPWPVVACGALSLGSVLTHDFGVGFALAAAFTVLMAGRSWLRRAATAAAVFLPSAILVLAGLRLKAASIYGGTAFGSSSPAVIGETFLKQAAATLPLSYALANPAPLALPPSSLYGPGAVLAVLGAGVAAALCWLCTRGVLRAPRGSALAAAVVVLLASAAATSVSLKYQQGLQWGVGYAQIYIQYFCLSALLAGGLAALLSAAARRPVLRAIVRGAAAAGLAVVFFVSMSHSGAVAEYLNQRWRYPREALAVALADQARQRSAADVEVRVDRDHLQRWETAQFLFQHTGWRGEFRSAAEPAANDEQPRQRFEVKYPAIADSSDVVVLIFSEASDRDGRLATGRTTVYAMCTDRSKLDTAFLVTTEPPGRIALKELPTFSSQGWAYKRIDKLRAGPRADYGIAFF